ncbi:UDP-N-acetylmuramate dehydrogenase [Pseudostreptobacillus hongkongensis]|uniref:UDP-N-acetylmuramate dehydrogenase n=1 Tax=Pseudostreptobacillus hongkongensis TaxID=1162717 RepID=UPI0028D2AE7D|nr:UDP-N-acetylmuramate dehydrogenase [Pseudostreptobacillus hongkongensis]
MRILENISMKDYSNMRVGGIAKELIFIEDKNELLEIFNTRNRIFVIGNGTNTLISDSYLDISFVTLKDMKDILIEKVENGTYFVRAYAGVDFFDFIDFMRDEDLSGIENMSGIPGSFGGITNMNAGAYGTEIFDVVEEVEVFEPGVGIRVLSKNELGSKYRSTLIKENKWLVVSTLIKLKKGFDKEASEDKLNQRKNKHPLHLPNLGSTFKNPTGTFAAQLISDCGLKEYRVGDAQISPIHPNFVTNLGNATFNDILQLIEDVKKVVLEKTNIQLETEIIILK